jgi:hypothetical protein
MLPLSVCITSCNLNCDLFKAFKMARDVVKKRRKNEKEKQQQQERATTIQTAEELKAI